MNCDNPRCGETGCPLESNIPEWIELAYRGQWQQANEAIHETNNFPEFTGAICPAPCQTDCKQAISGYAVRIRDVERQIVEMAFAQGWIEPRPAADRSGKQVAIIGSGPAGLAAAQQLAHAGHDVTVFEKDHLPGGLLRYGIPDFRLGKHLIDRRVDQLKAEGVAFQTGASVGGDISGRTLRDRFDAILLATGAGKARDLNVPGRDEDGVYLALDFLRGATGVLPVETATDAAAVPSAKDKAVVVIGGGETGNDCVETALLQGAREVHQLEILPNGNAGSQPGGNGLRPAETHATQVDRRWCVATKRFGGNGTGLTEIRAVNVRWTQSANGPVMHEVADSEFRLQADMALLALGYDAVLDHDLAEQFGLADDDGDVVTRDYATDVSDVFTAGDLATGASLVANAIHSGRQAAERIDQYLRQ